MRRLTGIALAAALALAGSAATGQNSSLIRLGERGDLLGWEAVGRVEANGKGYCTGVLIATDLVLTAAHCVFDPKTDEPVADFSLAFQAGWRDGKAIAERRVAAVSVSPLYRPSHGTSRGNLERDVALLKLSQPIPAATAAPFALFGFADAGQRVSVVSYGRGRDSALSWQRDCGLLGRQSGIMAFDCDVTFGSSGAPVFVRTGNRARILSLISQGAAKNGETVSFGMELPGIVAILKADLRKRSPIVSSTNAPRFQQVIKGSKKRKTGAKFVSAKD